jgi:hypothetical protein
MEGDGGNVLAIVGSLSLIVCVFGLLLWLILTKFVRDTWTQVAKICFAAGLLAFLFAFGTQSCSAGTSGAGTGTSTHAR